MAASTADEMEKRLVKRKVWWNANDMGVSSDGMEQKDEGQAHGMIGSGKKRDHDTESCGSSSKEMIKRDNVGIKSNDVLEWKVVIVFDETTRSHLHPIV